MEANETPTFETLHEPTSYTSVTILRFSCHGLGLPQTANLSRRCWTLLDCLSLFSLPLNSQKTRNRSGFQEVPTVRVQHCSRKAASRLTAVVHMHIIFRTSRLTLRSGVRRHSQIGNVRGRSTAEYTRHISNTFEFCCNSDIRLQSSSATIERIIIIRMNLRLTKPSRPSGCGQLRERTRFAPASTGEIDVRAAQHHNRI
jgi:hypothetical protein